MRLGQLKQSDEAKKLLAAFDHLNLLSDSDNEEADLASLEDDDLLAELGIELEDEENIFCLTECRERKKNVKLMNLTATKEKYVKTLKYLK
ncbi:hypothetical protein AB2762_04130 [Acinetobacter indicus]